MQNSFIKLNDNEALFTPGKYPQHSFTIQGNIDDMVTRGLPQFLKFQAPYHNKKTGYTTKPQLRLAENATYKGQKTDTTSPYRYLYETYNKAILASNQRVWKEDKNNFNLKKSNLIVRT